VPVVYCTDLFHPHDDPDDHFDIAVLYALEELDTRGIVLDQGSKQEHRPGRIPVEQLNLLTGRDVPWAVGLSEPLKTPDDKALDQAEKYQTGVNLILDVLEDSKDPVTIITVGSLRDLAAAFNRKPELFRQKISRLMIFIGEASAGTQEWNVGLDPNGFIRIMNSGLAVWWIPCFDGGNFKNKGNASFWKASHADLLRYSSDQVMNYFIYALLKKTSPDHLEYLSKNIDEVARRQVLSETRNMWCAAVFTEAAGRKIVQREGEWVAVPVDFLEKKARVLEIFRFARVSVFVDDDARIVYEETSRSRRIFRFQIVNTELYPEVMTSVTSHLIGDLANRQTKDSMTILRTGLEYRVVLNGEDCAKFSLPELTGCGLPQVKVSEVEDSRQKVNMCWDIPGEISQDELLVRFDLAKDPDFWWAPHLAPYEGYAVAQHVFHTPALRDKILILPSTSGESPPGGSTLSGLDGLKTRRIR